MLMPHPNLSQRDLQSSNHQRLKHPRKGRWNACLRKQKTDFFFLVLVKWCLEVLCLSCAWQENGWENSCGSEGRRECWQAQEWRATFWFLVLEKIWTKTNQRVSISKVLILSTTTKWFLDPYGPVFKVFSCPSSWFRTIILKKKRNEVINLVLCCYLSLHYTQIE